MSNMVLEKVIPDKLRTPPQAPPVFTGTPTSIVDDARRLMECARKVQNQVVEDVRPGTATFANVLAPLALAQNAMTVEAHILGFYKFVSPDPMLRDASNSTQKLLDDFSIETAMRQDFYCLVDAVLERNEELDPESRQLLVKKHKNYIRNGLRLSAGPKLDRFKEIKLRLNLVTLEFRKNLIEVKSDIWFLPQELDGVSEDILSTLERGESEGENKGKLRLSRNNMDFYPIMRYAKSSETRKRIYIAYDNKCNQNIPLFKEVMVLRDEAARLLGYPSHAAFRLEEKMAKSPLNLNTFLNDLRSKLTLDDLALRGESFDGRFLTWDLSFYFRLMLETQYQVDQGKIAEYFPLQTTLRGMLEIFQGLFGLSFLEITDDERNEKDGGFVWHEDVQVFSVWDSDKQDGQFVGYLYLDLYPREGKHGHAANFNLWPGFIQETGTRYYPAIALVCNISKPTSKKPSLLIPREVITLFHELSQAIHDLVSKTIYSSFHGTNTVIDFAEAPSQMLEHWCWEPLPLRLLSMHYSSLSPEYFKAWEEEAEEKGNLREKMPSKIPSEKIPEEIIESLIRAKHVNGA